MKQSLKGWETKRIERINKAARKKIKNKNEKIERDQRLEN